MRENPLQDGGSQDLRDAHCSSANKRIRRDSLNNERWGRRKRWVVVHLGGGERFEGSKKRASLIFRAELS
jgi:hypothetical protein